MKPNRLNRVEGGPGQLPTHNPIELNANPRLDIRVVRDLNQAPVLPFDDARFDAVSICLGTYYLVYPTRLLTHLARVVLDNAPLIMIYSNRWFPTKAVMPWLNLDDRGRGAFLRQILLRTGAWNVAVTLDCTPPGGDVLFAVIARRPLVQSSHIRRLRRSPEPSADGKSQVDRPHLA